MGSARFAVTKYKLGYDPVEVDVSGNSKFYTTIFLWTVLFIIDFVIFYLYNISRKTWFVLRRKRLWEWLYTRFLMRLPPITCTRLMFTCLFSGNFEIGQCLSYTDRFTLLFFLSFYRYNPFISLSAFIDIVLVYNYPYESGGCTAKVQWNICEALLMVEAYTKNIVCPSKHVDPLYPSIMGMCLKARLTLVERLNAWRQVLTTQISSMNSIWRHWLLPWW